MAGDRRVSGTQAPHPVLRATLSRKRGRGEDGAFGNDPLADVPSPALAGEGGERSEAGEGGRTQPHSHSFFA